MLLTYKNMDYIESVALSARKSVEEYRSVRTFNYEQVKEVVKHFGGEIICRDDISEVHVIKNTEPEGKDETEFTIYHSKENQIEEIFHELGHVFFDWSEWKPGAVFYNNGANSYSELRADFFARTFIMPEEMFKEVVLENTDDGVCKISEVADVFGIYYKSVITRGSELHLWNSNKEYILK